jgi:hypothetical protein
MRTGSDQLTASAPAIREAEQAVRSARNELLKRKDWYEASRRGGNETDIAIKRTDWGLAGCAYGATLTALLEAEDRQHVSSRLNLPALVGQMACPAEPAHAGPAQASLTTPTAPDGLPSARRQVRDCWGPYRSLRTRTDADPLDLDRARGRLQQALADFFRIACAGYAEEDKRHIADLRDRQERAIAFKPSDAFPRATSPAAEIAHASRERARSAALYRDRYRYDRK